MRQWWVVVCVFVTVTCRDHDMDVFESEAPGPDFVQEVNTVQGAWTAAISFLPGSPVKNILSALPTRDETLPLRKVSVRGKLQEQFDGRNNWKRCNIGRVREQGNCASAWAISAASVFSDRVCISKVGGGEVSAQHVLACCKTCGVSCLGGYVTEALLHLTKKGSPGKKCHPYELYPCPRLMGNISCPQVRAIDPMCRGYCRSGYGKRQPFMDLRRGSEAYSVRNSSDVIRSEILTRGPVVTLMDLYEDFLVYRSGVYSHTRGRLLARHPVKIVGWGVHPEGSAYWVVVNSWGTLWGDKGVAKVAVDTNGCNLENRVFAILT